MPQPIFFLGPDKCGSSWIFEILRRDPQIAVPGAKETFFFDSNYHLGLSWYQNRFDQSRDFTLDVSHDYLFHPLAPSRIAHFSRSSLLLVGMRNPLDRLLSAMTYMQMQGRLPRKTSVEQAITLQPELISHGLYGQNISRWLHHFPADSFLLLDFDLLVRDPQSLIGGLRDQIGLPPQNYCQEDLAPVNKATAPGLPAPLARLGRRAISRARRNGWLTTAQRFKVIGSALNRQAAAPRPVLDASMESDLAFIFAKDLVAFDSLMNTNYCKQWNLG